MFNSNAHSKPTKTPLTTHFKTVSTTEEVLKNLDILKMKDYERFVQVNDIGKKITTAVNNDSKVSHN
jgi:hypothetical protein